MSSDSIMGIICEEYKNFCHTNENSRATGCLRTVFCDEDK